MLHKNALLNLPVPRTAEAVLMVSPSPADHEFFRDVLSGSNWRLFGVRSRREALSCLRSNSIAVVISEIKLSDGAWKDVLADLKSVPNPPRLIVTSDLVDESLWAEALNYGAYDVLAKPFHPSEILRIISLAWRDWKESVDWAPVDAPAVLVAAG
jgi:two-component system OmpR family response regulator